MDRKKQIDSTTRARIGKLLEASGKKFSYGDLKGSLGIALQAWELMPTVRSKRGAVQTGTIILKAFRRASFTISLIWETRRTFPSSPRSWRTGMTIPTITTIGSS